MRSNYEQALWTRRFGKLLKSLVDSLQYSFIILTVYHLVAYSLTRLIGSLDLNIRNTTERALQSNINVSRHATWKLRFPCDELPPSSSEIVDDHRWRELGN